MNHDRDSIRSAIPTSDLTKIDNWVTKAQVPKDAFLLAIITSDIRQVFDIGFRNPNKLNVLPDLMIYFLNFVPDDAWGYREAPRQWQGLM